MAVRAILRLVLNRGALLARYLADAVGLLLRTATSLVEDREELIRC